MLICAAIARFIIGNRAATAFHVNAMYAITWLGIIALACIVAEVFTVDDSNLPIPFFGTIATACAAGIVWCAKAFAVEKVENGHRTTVE